MPCSIGRWFARDATGARGGKVAHGRQRFPRQGLRRAPCPKAMQMTACESTTVALRFSVSTPEGNGTFKKHQNAKPQKTRVDIFAKCKLITTEPWFGEKKDNYIIFKVVVFCSIFFCHRTNLLHVHSSCIWGMTLFKVVIFWREKTPWGKCPEGDTYLSCLLLQQVEKPQKSWAFPKFNRWESQKRFRQRGGFSTHLMNLPTTHQKPTPARNKGWLRRY